MSTASKQLNNLAQGAELQLKLMEFKAVIVANPLGPKLLHYITLSFRINSQIMYFFVCITELVSNYFLSYVISCVVAKHTMWTSDYIT